MHPTGSDSLCFVGHVYCSAAGDKVSGYYLLPELPGSAPPVPSDDTKSPALRSAWYDKKDGYGHPRGKWLAKNQFLRECCMLSRAEEGRTTGQVGDTRLGQRTVKRDSFLHLHLSRALSLGRFLYCDPALTPKPPASGLQNLTEGSRSPVPPSLCFPRLPRDCGERWAVRGPGTSLESNTVAAEPIQTG